MDSEILLVHLDYGSDPDDAGYLLIRITRKPEKTMTETMEMAQDAAEQAYCKWLQRSENPDGKEDAAIDIYITKELEASGLHGEYCDYTLKRIEFFC